MFFEFNGSVYDSVKLKSKRFCFRRSINSLCVQGFISLEDNFFFDEASLLVLETRFFPVEDISNFSF